MADSNNNATTTTTTATTAAAVAPVRPVTLLALEEDDEFEEFVAQDWDTSETYGATIKSDPTLTTAATKKSGLDSLWEDNWDDDDLEDSFSVQLRGELLKQGQAMET